MYMCTVYHIIIDRFSSRIEIIQCVQDEVKILQFLRPAWKRQT